jgi:PRTRC genetic system protein E
MFTELLPLLKERTLTMTVSMLKGSENSLRVCIVPKQLEYKKPDIGYDKDAEALNQKIETASKALNTPLSITGTAEEIDASLPKALAEYAAEMQTLQCDINEVRTTMEAAKKAIDEAKKNKSKTTAPKPATETKTAVAAEKAEPPSLGLFDPVPATDASTATSTSEAAATPEIAAPEATPVAVPTEPEALPLAAVSADDNTAEVLDTLFPSAPEQQQEVA